MLALGLGPFLGGSGAMAQNGWESIYEQTQTTSDDWTAITEGTTQGKILGAAQSGSNTTYYYYVTKSLNFTNNRTDNDENGNSGLKIHGTVYLYIPIGLTITCQGANADGRTGAGAGIELASGNTLYIIGGGTVNATGGNAENGRDGGAGTNAEGDNGNSWTRTGTGGTGGNGGGGAGAGIGTRGGTGGTGGSGGAGYKYDGGAEDDAENGTDGSNGTIGGSAGAMGTLYVANGTTVNTTGGSAGTSGGVGGQRGKSFAYDGSSYNVTTGAGGGGGGGGFGGAASNIGTGGRGGGGGGGGAGGAQDWRSNSSGGVYCVYANGGKGGQNANGNYAADGTDADTNGTAHANGWVYVANGSFNTTSDWNSASGDCSFGSRGSGGARGTYDTSAGTQNTGNLTYNITYSPLKTKVNGSNTNPVTVTYSPSGATNVVLPANTEGYNWVLLKYGKSCAPDGTAANTFATATTKYFGGNGDETSRTITPYNVYGDLVFQEVATMLIMECSTSGESANNDQEIEEFYDYRYNVTTRLQNRTLYRDNHWNTICLPFAMTPAQIAASPLAGATIVKLNEERSGFYNNKLDYQGLGYDHPVVLFWFDTVKKNTESLIAGQPYLVKWTAGYEHTEDGNYVDNTAKGGTRHELDFPGVTITATQAGAWEGQATLSGSVTFQGTFSLSEDLDEVDGDGNMNLVLGANNKLYHPSSTINVGACRGYFKVPQAAVAAAHEFVLAFDGGETTSIRTVNGSGLTVHGSDTYYNLNGQRLSAPQKGINIVNGKKVIIK